MAENLPWLPIGEQVFEEIRRQGMLYVDKTGYLPGLRRQGKVVFCARPRRFGKSLTVSALDAFYSGKKELFRGL
ncbi:MAG: AAA family ATPase, partial [Desulfovibrio sp.]|nr:AAA family ATPase [Desulfovibrio sp.]